MSKLTSKRSPEALRAEILKALTKPIEPVPVSALYRVGLAVTAVAMLILPLLYLGLIGLIGHTIWWVWVHAPIAQWDPWVRFLTLIVGVILLLFLIKPWFAGDPQQATPQRLKESAEPFLFEYVAQLCEIVRSPVPKSIRVNTQVNASASFRLGMLSLLRNDMTLTIGLPLVAGMSLRELTGVLAHEFGHFAQGAGMRAYYIIATINGWFFRAAYERDSWDEYLRKAADNLPIRLGIFVYMTIFFVWLTRLMLAAVAWVGHGISCWMSRQMEFDADLHEIRVAGSAAFATSCRRITDLNLAQMMTFDHMSQLLSEGHLPDDFPAMVVSSVPLIPKELRKQVRSFERDEQTGWFDTHPTNVDRIARARQENDPGIMVLEGNIPATALFQDFKKLCKIFTTEYYKEVLEKDFKKSLLKPVSTMIARRDAEVEAGKALDRYFQAHIPIFRALILDESVTRPLDDPRAAAATLRASREKMLALVDEYDLLTKRYDLAETKLLLSSEAEVISKCGISVKADQFQLPSNKSKVIQETVRRARLGVEALASKMLEFEELATARLTAALQLLQLPQIYNKIENGESLCNQIVAILGDARVVSSIVNDLQPTRIVYRRLSALLSRLETDESNALYESIMDQMRKLHTRLTSLQDDMEDYMYPLDHGDESQTLKDYVLPVVPDLQDLGGLIGATRFSAERVMGIQVRLVAKLAHAAEKVEEAFGMPPLKERKPKLAAAAR
jgi:Zn-dependent protease with chaperone function